MYEISNSKFLDQFAYLFVSQLCFFLSEMKKSIYVAEESLSLFFTVKLKDGIRQFPLCCQSCN